MRTEIYIEDYPLDLTQDISTEFVYSVDDIMDFGSKNTSYSKTITIAGSANNNKLFGFIFDLGNANFTDSLLPNVGYNFNASKTAQCRIFVDRIQIFKGVLRLLEIVNDNGRIEYQCSVFGELGGFISALGNKKIEELDFSSYNEAWTSTNITDSWDAVSGSGVYYPLIDYGKVSTDKIDFQFKAFKPALYVKEYLEKILVGSGYAWNFPFLDTNLMKRLIIPSNRAVISNPSSNAFNATADNQSYSTDNYPDFTVLIAGDFTLVGNAYQYNGVTSLPATVTLELQGSITDVFPDPPPDTTVTISLQINGSSVVSQTISVAFEPQGFSISLTHNHTFATNDTVNAFVSSEATTYSITQGILKVEAGSGIIDVPVNYGEGLLINNAIPKGIFQRDFFISICKMFNLYVYDDQFDDKKLIIKPYVDFYDGSAIDWTNKIDRAKPLSIKPMSEINARYYQFKYKQDNDYYAENYRKKFNEGYGDFIYDTEFDFVKDTDTTEIIFANSTLFQYTGTDKIYPAIYKLSNENTKEDPIDSVVRIMQAKKITGRTSWKIKNGVTDLVTLTAYGYAGHLDDPFTLGNDICFGAPKEIYFTASSYPTTNLFNAYYSDYMAEVTDKNSKLLSCNVLLNTLDILNLDFSKLIYIDGSLFRLNKVTGYNPIDYQTTKVELLKVINKIF